MRYIFGFIGVIAATVLLLVSAAMNWRFGFGLGKTEFDGIVYGLASAAADGLKALTPFLVIAALRSRKWVQAMAGVFLGVICAAYSLTSSLGFASLNRNDNIGERQAQVAAYKALKDERKRLGDKLSWIPQHRPVATVEAELSGLLAQPVNSRTLGRGTVKELTADCTLSNWVARKYCSAIHNSRKELALAKDAHKLESRIGQLDKKLSQSSGIAVAEKADPQAEIISEITGFNIENIQMGLILLVSLLVEAGSALGFFVVVALWNNKEPHKRLPKLRGRIRKEQTAVSEGVLPNNNDNLVRKVIVEEKQARTANTLVGAIAGKLDPSSDEMNKAQDSQENQRAAEVQKEQPKRAILSIVKSDLERYYETCIEHVEGSSTTATALYEHYCDWCGHENVEPLALPQFSLELNKMGIKKSKVAGRIRYVGIRLGAGESEGRTGKDPRMVA